MQESGHSMHARYYELTHQLNPNDSALEANVWAEKTHAAIRNLHGALGFSNRLVKKGPLRNIESHPAQQLRVLLRLQCGTSAAP